MSDYIDPTGIMYIKQEGYFYGVSDNDAYILNKYLGYKLYGIHKVRTGFPIYARKSVLKLIDSLEIDYDLLDQNGCVILSKRFPENRYERITSYDYLGTKEPIIKKPKLTIEEKMQIYLNVLEGLSEGIDINTGEIIEGISDELMESCFEIATYFDKTIKRKNKAKENMPSQNGKRWTKEDDELLLFEYNKGKTVKELSEIFERSTGSIGSRLLSLINLK